MTPDQARTSPAPSHPGSRSSRRGPALLWLVLAVALGVWVIDQVTKWLAVTRLEGKTPVQLIGDWVTFTFLRNPGAAFSLGSGSTVLFTVVAVAVVVVILRVARRLRSVWWAIALGALLGGALGNLTDRLTRAPGFPSGHVVDFISVKYFAVFNCADMAIVGSAILMVVLSLLGVEFGGERRAEHLPEADDAAGGGDADEAAGSDPVDGA